MPIFRQSRRCGCPRQLVSATGAWQHCPGTADVTRAVLRQGRHVPQQLPPKPSTKTFLWTRYRFSASKCGCACVRAPVLPRAITCTWSKSVTQGS